MEEIVQLHLTRLEEKLDAILEQTTKTNGRVGELERKVTDLEKFKVQIVGLAMGASTVVAILWALASKLINFSFNIK